MAATLFAASRAARDALDATNRTEQPTLTRRRRFCFAAAKFTHGSVFK